MTVFSKTWDESVPAGSRSISLGDNDIRDFKAAMRERLAEEHRFYSDEDSNVNIGLHNKVSFYKQTSDPLYVADTMVLFGKVTGGKTEIHSVSEDDVLSQLTLLGKLWIKGLKVGSQTNKDLIHFDGSVWDRYPWNTFVQDLLADANFLAGLPNNKMSGDIVAIAYASTITPVTSSSGIPGDNTIPQISEGTEFLTVAYTPTKATNYLLITATAQGACAGGNGGGIVIALFQDAITDALAAARMNSSASSADYGVGGTMSLQHYMLAGTTSEITFRLRFGPWTSGTAGIGTDHQHNTNQNVGRTLNSIVVMEVEV